MKTALKTPESETGGTSLVSVIIPVYNVLPYLREALDSAIDQTYRNLEIIIVDDGSTDGSGPVCDEYKRDSRVTVIHQENRGLSGARNTGLKVAAGDYIAFLDSDDAFFPEMIRIMVDGLERTGADLAVCNFMLHQKEAPGKKRSFSGNEEVLTSQEALNCLINGKICFAVWNKLYRKELWEGICFPDGHVHEDVMVMVRLFEKSRRVLTIPTELIRYRVREDNISNTRSVRNSMDYLLAYKSLEEYVESHTPELFAENSFQTYRRNNVGEIHRRYTEMAISGESAESAEIFRKELLEQLSHLENRGMTKWIFVLLKYAPRLYLPARTCFRFVMHALGKGE